MNLLPNHSVGKPLPITGRLERIEFIPGVVGVPGVAGYNTIVRSSNGVPVGNLSSGVSFDTVGNSFYIVDCPFPLYVNTSISAGSKYAVQTGETFNQPMRRLNILGCAFPAQINSGFYHMTVWIGNRDEAGFVDCRQNLSPNNLEVSSPLTSALVVLGSGAVATAMSTQTSITALDNGRLVAFDVSNTHATQWLYYTDSIGNFIAAIPPNSSKRISLRPSVWSINTVQDTVPPTFNSGNIYFSNPGAAAMSIFVAAIYQTNSFMM